MWENQTQEVVTRPIAALTTAPRDVEVPASQGHSWANAQGVYGVAPLRHGFSALVPAGIPARRGRPSLGGLALGPPANSCARYGT